MRHIKISRGPSTNDGTFGKMVLDDNTTFFTGELPWDNNKNRTSSIPVGTYICKWILSPKHGHCYQVTNVPNRDMIEIHSANFMGDVSQGKISQLLGCIALGLNIGPLEGQQAVLQSKVAISNFEHNMKEEDFELTIV